MSSFSKYIIRTFFPFLVPAIRALKLKFKHNQSRLKIKNLLKQGRDICIELGAGDVKGQGEWLTVDITQNADVCWDLRFGIPFPDNTVSKIYSSHFFEHLTFNEGQILLKECRRVLKVDGIFLINVPDARWYVEEYLKPSRPGDDSVLSYLPAYNRSSRIDFLNYIAYLDGHHKYMFDSENVLSVMTLSGLNNARLRDYDPILDRDRSFASLFAMAEK